jgi:hypothetical protein
LWASKCLQQVYNSKKNSRKGRAAQESASGEYFKYTILVLALGRGLVWIYVAVFIVTVSCALACPEVAFAPTAKTCHPQSEDECLGCVDTNFVKEGKCLEAFLYIVLPDHTRVEQSDMNPSSLASIYVVLPYRSRFLKTTVLLL